MISRAASMIDRSTLAILAMSCRRSRSRTSISWRWRSAFTFATNSRQISEKLYKRTHFSSKDSTSSTTHYLSSKLDGKHNPKTHIFGTSTSELSQALTFRLITTLGLSTTCRNGISRRRARSGGSDCGAKRISAPKSQKSTNWGIWPLWIKLQNRSQSNSSTRWNCKTWHKKNRYNWSQTHCRLSLATKRKNNQLFWEGSVLLGQQNQQNVKRLKLSHKKPRRNLHHRERSSFFRILRLRCMNNNQKVDNRFFLPSNKYHFNNTLSRILLIRFSKL